MKKDFLKQNVYYILSFLFLFFSLFIYFHSPSRSFIKNLSENNRRHILSKIITSKLNNSMEIGIFKIKKHDQIWLEIYKNPLTEFKLIDTLKLEGKFDAHITIEDQSSNLVIANIDGDKEYEIVAPTYNKKMKPILNVFKYDPVLKEFKRINTKNSKPIL